MDTFHNPQTMIVDEKYCLNHVKVFSLFETVSNFQCVLELPLNVCYDTYCDNIDSKQEITPDILPVFEPIVGPGNYFCFH